MATKKRYTIITFLITGGENACFTGVTGYADVCSRMITSGENVRFAGVTSGENVYLYQPPESPIGTVSN